MTERIYNFSAGPAILPLPVLEKAAERNALFRRYRNERDGNQPSLKTF